MPFLMVRDDITKIFVDVIVKPVDEEKLGEAVVTEAIDLPARYIIHVVNPIRLGGQSGEDELLYKTYMQALILAKQQRLESIAFPLLSSGNDNFPKDRALRIAVNAISDFLIEDEILVYLVIYDDNVFTLSKELFNSITEYINDHYIETNDVKINENRANLKYAQETRISLNNKSKSFLQESVETAITRATSNNYTLSRGLDYLIDNIGETFSTMLLRLIDERGLKDSYVYKKANIDRRLFSKIRNNINYEPSKKTVLAFAIALELSLAETNELLMRAGYALSNCSKFDIIVCYFIENEQYDIYVINEMLFAYRQPLLGV